MYLALLHLVNIISNLAALAAEADRMVVESVAETTRKAYTKVVIKLGDFCVLQRIKDKFSIFLVILWAVCCVHCLPPHSLVCYVLVRLRGQELPRSTSSKFARLGLGVIICQSPLCHSSMLNSQ